MKNIKIIVGFIIVVLVIITILIFIKENNAIPEEKYRISKIMHNLPGDSLNFWYMPSSLYYHQGKFVISDRGNHRITILDTNLNISSSLGKKGKGPGEFNEPCFAVLKNRKLYVADVLNHRIQIFHENGKFINSFSAVRLLCSTKFVVDNQGYIFLPNLSFDNTSLYIKYNANGEIINRYGKQIEYQDPIISRAKNYILLEIDQENNIYTIFYEVPLIRKYDSFGKLIWEKGIRHVREINKRVKHINKIKSKENMKKTFQSLAIYSMIYKEKLYVKYSGTPRGPIIGFSKITGDILHKINVLGINKKNTALYEHSFCLTNGKFFFLDRLSNCLVKCEKL